MNDWAKAQEKRRQKIVLDNQRLIDLVRYCRHRLHEENLITDEEFADLVKVGSESARRLESYDDLRMRLDRLQGLLDRQPRRDRGEPEAPLVRSRAGVDRGQVRPLQCGRRPVGLRARHQGAGGVMDNGLGCFIGLIFLTTGCAIVLVEAWPALVAFFTAMPPALIGFLLIIIGLFIINETFFQ